MATHSSTFALQKEPNASFPVENHGTRGLEDALLPPGSVSSVLLAVYLPSHTKAHSMKVAHSRDNTSNSGSSGRAAGLFTEKKVNGPEQRGGGGRKCTRDRAKAQHELTWDSRLHWPQALLIPETLAPLAADPLPLHWPSHSFSLMRGHFCPQILEGCGLQTHPAAVSPSEAGGERVLDGL